MKDKNGIWCNRLFTVRKDIDGTEFYFKKDIDAYLVDVKKHVAELEAKLSDIAAIREVEKFCFDSIRDLNECFPCPPVAKPIVWEGSDDSSWLGRVGDFNFNILCDEQDGVKYWGVAVFLDGNEVANQDVDNPDEGKQVAQDWLNKLVAQCAVVGNPTAQFTKEEVEAIRKIAQFMGVTVADSIIAKCDAMLKGAQE